MRNEHTRMIREANSRLLKTLAHMDDKEAGEPSLLPGWNRAMLITHLVSNAIGTQRVLEAALEGRVGEKYPGGVEGREAEIQAGRALHADELKETFGSSADKLSDLIEAAPDAVWDSGGTMLGRPTTVRDQVLARYRELEVHHADLDMGYLPSDWPHGFVFEEIDKALPALAQRLPDGVCVVMAADSGHHWIVGDGAEVELAGPAWELLWWIMGRGAQVGGKTAPELRAWT